MASFGNALHVSASSLPELDTALDAALHVLGMLRNDQLQIASIEPSLEDVFIALMRDAEDNYG